MKETSKKKIDNLLKEIESNQYFMLRDDGRYTPSEISDSTREAISDVCYYKLRKCMDLLKELKDEQ